MSLTALPFSCLAETTVTLSQVLRERRLFVSRELERVCQETIQPRILSAHNGLMREADPVLPLCAARGGDWVAVDNDLTRLAEIKREYGTGCLRCVSESLFVNGGQQAGSFHYAYALNRLSELNDRAARRELARLRRALRKGGTVLVSCFTPEAAQLYWNGNCPPFLREVQQLAALAAGLDKCLRGRTAWSDESGMVAYLQLEAD